MSTKFPSFLLFLLFLRYSKGELNFEDVTLYPIIINMEADKAVFIVPEVGCHVVQDVRLIERVLSTRNSQHYIYLMDGKSMESLIDSCDLLQQDRINATQFVISLREKSFFIFPGTHFCGAGNDAANYEDLGTYRDTDACCREHDFCTEFIDGWSCHSKVPELCNKTPFTRSHCDCDQRFRECLQRSNDTASVHIGLLYFTVFGLKCFKEEYPIVECEEYGGFLNIHCQRYKLDMSKAKTFQFFDSPKYQRLKTLLVNDNNKL